MESVLIGQKLEALRHCISCIVEKCPADAASLAEDADLQDIVVLNLTRSVQLCVDIASHLIAASEESAPATMGEALTTLARMGVIEDEVAPTFAEPSDSVILPCTITRRSTGRSCTRSATHTSMTSGASHRLFPPGSIGTDRPSLWRSNRCHIIP